MHLVVKIKRKITAMSLIVISLMAAIILRYRNVNVMGIVNNTPATRRGV